jgi:hypothetical protein
VHQRTGADVSNDRFSIAKRKPRLWLVLLAAVVLVATSIYMFSTGEVFAGSFPLALGCGIALVYSRYRTHPELDVMADNPRRGG